MNRIFEKSGKHYLSELHSCEDLSSGKFSAKSIHAYTSKLIKKYGLHELGNFFYTYDTRGVTGVICLAESHISIHTWPEKNYVTLDVFVCNYHFDNSRKAKNLLEELIVYFRPGKIKRHEIDR